MPLAQADEAAMGGFLGRYGPMRRQERPWLALVADEAASGSPLLTSVLKACSNGMWAVDMKQPEVRERAYIYHTNAVTQLHDALKGPHWSHPNLIYATVMLNMYEVRISFFRLVERRTLFSDLVSRLLCLMRPRALSISHISKAALAS